MVWLLAILVFLLPLVVWPTSTDFNHTKSVFALIAVSALLVVWAAGALVRREWRIRIPWPSVAVAAFGIASGLSLLQATDGRNVLQSLALVACFFLVYLIVTQFVREKRDVTLILFSLLTSAALASVYGLLQYVGTLPGTNGQVGLDGLVSTMGNRNYLGEFLASLLFPAAILVLRLHSRVLRLVSLGLIAFSFGVALLVRQTSVLVALPAAFILLLVGIALFRPIAALRRNRAWIVALLAALGLAFLVAGPSGPLVSGVGLSADSQESWLARIWQENSGSVRSWDWQIGVEMLRDHPVVGVGLGNYKVDFLAYKAKTLASPAGAPYDFYMSRAAWAHSEYVQVAAELGGLGILAMLGFLVAVPLSFWRRLDRSGEEDRLDLLLLGCGVVVFLVLALVGFPAHLASSSLVLVVTMGLASSRAYGEGAEWDVAIRGRPLPLAVAAACAAAIAASIIAARDFSGDVLLVRGNQALQVGVPQVAEATLRESAALDFAPSQVVFSLGLALAQQGRYAEAAAEFEKCLTRFVTEGVYLALARATYAAGDLSRARQAIDLLLAPHPLPNVQSQAVYVAALIDGSEGNPSAGTARLEALVDALPDCEGAYIALGDFDQNLRRPEAAKESYEKALSLIDEKLAALDEALAPGRTFLDKEYAPEISRRNLLRREREYVESALRGLTSPQAP